MPFSPSDLPSYKLGIDASGTLYSDAAGTTPATTDGTGVLNAPDASGSGNALTRGSGAGGVLRIENGARVLSLEGGYLNKNVASGSLSAFSLHAFVKFTTPVGSNALFAFGSDSAGPFLAPTWVTAMYAAYQIASTNVAAAGYQTDANWHHVANVYNGSTIRTWLDGAEIGQSVFTSQVVGGEPAVASFTRAGYSLGKEATFVNLMSGRLAELCYYEGAQTDADVVSFGSYFRSKWAALLNTTDPQVLWVGNSLLTNTVNAQADTLPYLVGNASAVVNRWISACRPGITTAQMLARITDDYAHFLVSPSPKVAVIWEGYNDTGTAAQRYARLVTLAGNLRMAGATRIVTATLPLRTAETQAVIDDLNNLLRGDTVNFDALADIITADPTLSTPASDGVHFDAAQNAIIAPVFQAAIEAALSSGSGGSGAFPVIGSSVVRGIL